MARGPKVGRVADAGYGDRVAALRHPGRLQVERDVIQRRVPEKVGHRRRPDLALTQVGMPVVPRAKPTGRVVQMDHRQSL